MRKIVRLLLAVALMTLGGCSVNESAFDHAPEAQFSNTVSSGPTVMTVDPDVVDFTYFKDGKSQTQTVNGEVHVSVKDVLDAQTGVHFYNVWIHDPIPDKVTVLYTSVKGSFDEKDYTEIPEFYGVSFSYDSEHGNCMFACQNGYTYRIIAEWDKKNYRENGYYGTAEYYICFEE